MASITAAVCEEIAAARGTAKSAWLEIDGIELLNDAPGNFVYRLILSSPARFGADQAVTFQSRNPKDTVQAVIVRSDDEGLVVECQKPLPTDAKLLSVSFDPAFILRALEDFVLEMAPKGGRIAGLLSTKTIRDPGPARPRAYPGLNAEQAQAVEEMASTPLHFLWSPPGTGKTTTLGTAIARWLRQGRRVLVVSTSNAAVAGFGGHVFSEGAFRLVEPYLDRDFFDVAQGEVDPSRPAGAWTALSGLAAAGG